MGILIPLLLILGFFLLRWAAQIKTQMDFIQKNAERYAAFVPKQVFDILGKKQIVHIELGDQKEIQAAVLNLVSHQFYGLAKQMSGARLFGMVNIMLEEIIPVIGAQEGIIEKMAGDRVFAFYPEGSRRALLSAISICENGNWMVEQGGKIPSYWAVIHYGSIRVGVVGQQERMSVVTISEISTLSAFLEHVGKKYGARILITESAVSRISDFSTRFHARLIGYVFLNMNQSLEAIYDAYDGDPVSVRQNKENTKDLFLQALEDYMGQKYYDARLKFAHVLRANPQDLAARAYVYRCDDYYQSGEKQAMDVWLEQY